MIANEEFATLKTMLHAKRYNTTEDDTVKLEHHSHNTDTNWTLSLWHMICLHVCAHTSLRTNVQPVSWNSVCRDCC